MRLRALHLARRVSDRGRLLGGLLAVSITSCDPHGLQELGTSLLDPDGARLDAPGRQLASGEYSDLALVYSQDEGTYVAALRHDLGDARMTLVPYPNGEPCDYAPAVEFDPFSSWVEVEQGGVVAVRTSRLEQAPSFGSVRYVDFRCREAIDALENVALPGYFFPGFEPRGELFLDLEGALHFVDFAERGHDTIATDVSSVHPIGNWLVTVEAGKFVVRGEDFRVHSRVGEDVSDVVTTAGSIVTAVFSTKGMLLYWSYGGNLHAISESACSPRALGLNIVAFHDPCEERRLNLLVLSHAVGAAEDASVVRLRGPEGVRLDSVLVNPTERGERTRVREISFLVTSDPEDDAGALAIATLPESIQPEDGIYDIESHTLAENVTSWENDYYTDFEDRMGTLLDFERDDSRVITGVTEVAERVAWVSRGTEDVTFLQDIDDGETGTLVFVDELGPYEIARRVIPDSVRFLEDPFAVVYRRDSGDPGHAELHAWLAESELDVLIHEAVSEFYVFELGVLYAVPDGEDQGLWFAKAR